MKRNLEICSKLFEALAFISAIIATLLYIYHAKIVDIDIISIIATIYMIAAILFIAELIVNIILACIKEKINK